MKSEIICEINKIINSQIDGGGRRYVIGVDMRPLSLLIDFMEQVIKGANVRKLRKHAIHIRRYAGQFDSNMVYAPHLKLFFDVWSSHEISQYQFLEASDQKFMALFESFIKAMKEEGARIDINRKVRDWERSAKDNAESVSVYLDYLHERYARLIVIRLDLHMHASACVSEAQAHEWNEQEKTRMRQSYESLMNGTADYEAEEENLRAPLQLLAAKWRHLYDNMRGKRSLFKAKVGHLVCFEYARASGYHIHLILLFDGSKRTLDHEWLAGEIGRYWNESITQGRGYHINCNARKYRHNGIGVVNYHDSEKRRNLLTAALYLAKAEQFICAKPSKGFKTFSHGQIPSGWVKGLGRPRSKNQQTDDRLSLPA